MTQEEKDLLLKDLCGRLPYGVKVKVTPVLRKDYKHLSFDANLASVNVNFADVVTFNGDSFLREITEIKPYLFPLSSMTEEQKEELEELTYGSISVSEDYFYDLDNCSKMYTHLIVDVLDWLNANHFDYRGLIEKSLALDATNLGIYE